MTQRTGNPENLRRAASAKQDAARHRAEQGLRDVIKRGAPISFHAVAQAAGVSRAYLYRCPELRERILTLRAAQAADCTTGPRQPDTGHTATADTSAVIRTLTHQIAQERRLRRSEVSELTQALAAAHGRILDLQRQYGAGPADSLP